MRLSADEIKELCGGSLIYKKGDRPVTGVCLNSREVSCGDLFVPIVGERVDAHRFLKDAVKAGASCVFTQRHGSMEELCSDTELYDELMKADSVAVIYTKDTIGCLQRLGRNYHLKKADMPVIGVTGSVGKTTTREMIACALSAGKKVFATKGNLNSQVGVPMTMLSMEDEDIAVIELGISKPGEMDRIAGVAMPEAAVITNIGTSHIEFLGSREGILREKLRIAASSGSDPVMLFINGDNDMLCGLSLSALSEFGIPEGAVKGMVKCGLGADCDVRAEAISQNENGSSFRAVFYVRDAEGRLRDEPVLSHDIRLSVQGEHMILDALFALALCRYYGVDLDAAAKRLSAFHNLKGRGEMLTACGICFIDDSYNASPDSMKAELSVIFSRKGKGRRIAVLADMLELGTEAELMHRDIGRFILEQGSPLDQLLLYGELAAFVGRELECSAKGGKMPEIRYFSEKKELRDYLLSELRESDTVLFKGSNSMGLSALLQELKEDIGSGKQA